MANQTRPSSDSVQVVHELDTKRTWIDTETAANMLGIKVSSLNYKIYGGDVYGVKISGVLLCDKQSVLDHKKAMQERDAKAETRRAEKEQEAVKKQQQKDLLERFKDMSPEQLQKLLEQTQTTAK